MSAFLRPTWPAPANVHSLTTVRTGGVSVAPYDSFNLAAHVGDDSQAVAANRRRLHSEAHLPAPPTWLNQVHGVAVVEAGDYAVPPTADACFTAHAGRVCAVLTADCLPVLFCNRDGTRVAAAHAGWRGLAAGVLDQTVRALGVHAGDLIAWLGPAISSAAFEVGDDVRSAFLAQDPGAALAFTANARQRWQCDLYELARRNLRRLGIEHLYGGEYCTYASAERFYSYRRDGQCGRMATLIWATSN